MSGSLAALLPPPGGELCVHTAGRDWSRDDLRARVEEHMSRLCDAGAEPGAPVGVRLSDGAEVVAALFAVWRLGAAYVPLNPRSTDAEIGKAVARAGVAFLVEDAGIRATGVPVRQARDVALVSFTSGTTGEPKPVPLTHDRVLGLLDKVIGTLRAAPASRAPMPNLIPVSLALWAGIYQVLFAFRVGAPVVLLERFGTAEFAELVRRFAIRSTVLPPAAMVMLNDDPAITDLAPLRYVRSISSPLSPLQARRFKERFGLYVLNCYGQTELGGEVVGWTAADAKSWGDDKLGAVGKPHSGVEVRTGGGGELLVRTPDLDPGACGDDRLTGDGWFRTGDVGRVDEDGFVWVDGRVSDMINRGGLKVHPAEVEEVLRLAPAIADAAVVGAPDDRLGEVPWAFYVPAGGPPDDAELAAHCRTWLAPYKIPTRFVPVAQLPRNEAGKVLKRSLLERM